MCLGGESRGKSDHRGGHRGARNQPRGPDGSWCGSEAFPGVAEGQSAAVGGGKP